LVASEEATWKSRKCGPAGAWIAHTSFLSHAESRTNLAVQEWDEPFLLLLL